jgi:hypothetical protein
MCRWIGWWLFLCRGRRQLLNPNKLFYATWSFSNLKTGTQSSQICFGRRLMCYLLLFRIELCRTMCRWIGNFLCRDGRISASTARCQTKDPEPTTVNPLDKVSSRGSTTSIGFVIVDSAPKYHSGNHGSSQMPREQSPKSSLETAVNTSTDTTTKSMDMFLPSKLSTTNQNQSLNGVGYVGSWSSEWILGI